jgi:flagellar motor switch protein FliM
MHEGLARMLAHSLDLSLGSPLDIKLRKADQVGARDFVASLSPTSYLVPFGVEAGFDRVIARFENSLLFPLLDLLLGGTGEPYDYNRELTEIDEELFRSVTELMCAQLERAWKVLDVAVSPLPSIKPSMLGQMFVPEDRVVELEFEIRLGETTNAFALVLPMTLASALVRNSHENSRRGVIRTTATRRLEERLLNCRMRVSADLPNLSVPLGELVALQKGVLLNLRVPVQTAVRLRIGNCSTFEVMPVRQGSVKAAQLVRPLSEEEQDG